MKELKKYDINLAKLSLKTHRFEFSLDDDFFALFEQSYIIHGNLDAIIDLERSERLITMHFSIKGEVQLICDRSLEEFMHPIDVQETLILKFGEEEKELSEDMLQITNDTQSINVAQHLFDYIGLAVPMKKLHPKYRTDEDEDSEQDILIFSTSTDRGMIDDEDDNKDDNPDPRWDALRKISDN